MICTMQGLNWETPSPSHFKLVLPREDSSVDISFLGDRWCLFLCHDGHTNTRLFPCRDDAVTLVANAFHQGGLI